MSKRKITEDREKIYNLLPIDPDKAIRAVRIAERFELDSGAVAYHLSKLKEEGRVKQLTNKRWIAICDTYQAQLPQDEVIMNEVNTNEALTIGNLTLAQTYAVMAELYGHLSCLVGNNYSTSIGVEDYPNAETVIVETNIDASLSESDYIEIEDLFEVVNGIDDAEITNIELNEEDSSDITKLVNSFEFVDASVRVNANLIYNPENSNIILAKMWKNNIRLKDTVVLFETMGDVSFKSTDVYACFSEIYIDEMKKETDKDKQRTMMNKLNSRVKDRTSNTLTFLRKTGCLTTEKYINKFIASPISKFNIIMQ